MQASVKDAVKEFQKLLPAIKKQLSGIQKEFEKVNIKDISAKVDMKSVEKQAKEAAKKVKEAFDPSDTSGMKINGMEYSIKQIRGYVKEVQRYKAEIGTLDKYKNINTNSAINAPKYEETELDKMYAKWGRGEINASDIKAYTNDGKVNKVDVEPSEKSLSLWDMLKQKIQQIKPYIEQFKQSLNSGNSTKELELVKYKISEIEEKLEKAENGEIHLNTKEILQAEAELEKLKNKKANLEDNGKSNPFSKWGNSISLTEKQLNGVSGITIKIKNQIKQWDSGMKTGLKQVLKYAGALFSLRSIYSTLSSSAQSWLSSQNSGAQQLSANIEYMKYAMGSAFAPVIEYVINLVYQLMKAIQSLVYAFSGINIFAKATASSMNKTAGSASKASKSLAGVHNEINNVSENDSSGGSGSVTPSIELSEMENTSNTILDAIKRGNWYQVGVTIGEKLNEVMDNIPWNKIQSTAQNISKGIADTLNGFISKADWKKVGNTFAQGINTVIYTGQTFFNMFDFGNFGRAIGTSVSSFIENIDWTALGQTLSKKVEGIFDAISGFFETFDWSVIITGLLDFISGFEWSNVSDAIFRALGSACASLVNLGMVIGEKINEAVDNAKEYFQEKIEECGGDVVLGILKGIGDAVIGIGQWIYEHIFKPFIEGFKNVFGIHSPSTVMAEQGKFIMEGLLNGINNLVNNVTEIWSKMKDTVVKEFTNIKNSISNIWQQVKDKTSETWNTIKGKVKEGAQGAWNGITSIFGNIPNWFRDKFTQAWQAVKNVFSTGGKIFDGIKEGILEGLKSIVNAIITGINKVISIPFNGLNSALRSIKNAEIMGLKPFSWINTISIPQIPRLAKGNVAYSETMAIFGEYAGASTNPEITTPQNIMRETFEEVLSNHEWNNSSEGTGLEKLEIHFGSTKVALEIERLLQQARRQNGVATVTI